MGKFKIGDRVRVGVAVHGAPVSCNGSTGVIESVGDDDYKVRMDADGDYWWYQDEELTLVGSPLIPPIDQAPTLLDQFAMAALTGMCAYPDCEGTYDDIAMQVYQIAQAMMKAREVQK